jgi:Fic family protein
MKDIYISDDYLQDLLVRMAHHSTAIEGNSLTLGETKSILIDGYIPRPIELRELNEVNNYRKYIAALLSDLADDIPLDLDYIRKTHAILCTDAIEGIAGQFKTIPNIILGSDITLTPPYRVPEELKNWCEDLAFQLQNTSDNAAIVEAICHQHIKFERIHPFSDGNGRVGRALMCYSCFQKKVAPIIIPVEKRKEYINYLNNYDLEGFTKFALQIQAKEYERMELIHKTQENRL